MWQGGHTGVLVLWPWIENWKGMSNSKNLMPWPGPQLTSSIHKLVVPGPIETQSSPVWMLAPVIVTPVDPCTWIPSVFGLFPGAFILTPCTSTRSQLSITMWYNSLFIDDRPLIETSLELRNVSDCFSEKEKKNWYEIEKTIMSYLICLYHFSMPALTVAPFGQLRPEALQPHRADPEPSKVPP